MMFIIYIFLFYFYVITAMSTSLLNITSYHTVYDKDLGPHYELGDNIQTSLSWKPVDNIIGSVKMVCAGKLHYVVVLMDNSIWTWGNNDMYQLGRDGDIQNPGKVELRQDELCVDVSCGSHISVVLTDVGCIYVWGTFQWPDEHNGVNKSFMTPTCINNMFNLNHAETIIAIATGTEHLIVLTSNSRVGCIGNGCQCQLGWQPMEARVENSWIARFLDLKDITLIGCGGYNTFAVDCTGQVYAFGWNVNLQTGIDDKQGVIKTPKKCQWTGLPSNIVDIQGGEYHSLVRLDDGTVYEFGAGTAEPQWVPKQVDILKDIKALSTGFCYTAAVTKDGKLYYRNYQSDYEIYKEIAFEGRIIDAAVGFNHILVVGENKKLYISS